MRIKAVFASLALGSALVAGSAAMAAEGPYTQAQLDKGKSEYNGACRQCHAKEGAGALGPALKGDAFLKVFGGKPVAELRDYIHTNMPQNAPGSLTEDQLNVLTAYILSLNGFTPGQTEMSADSAKGAQLTP
ncbi:c-type cytochrome [Hansschlegelia plantiphila]|uniref:Cytochrome c domain-containing protein n=1 Tax=Hansschlegelia plantiphila TaxID=374655 RepID=A0A9W6MW04_9HYPH|nr:cytochrome c [Hansschlegelia plantiphila]GLK68337.1 hypothetical protein GCM10008179_19750 [Hansschlegelia plantiphila]